MKLTRFKIHTIFLLGFFWIQVSPAQNIQSVTPTNAAASANEIAKMFGDLINVTASDIEAFYLSTWDTHSYMACVKPDVSIIDVNDNSIEFGWDVPSGVTQTTAIHYMRLSSVGTMSTSSSTGSKVIHASNDLYLFVFQTECGTGRRGAADIVIIDKPVLLHGAPCKCQKYDIVEEMFDVDFIGGAAESYPWPQADSADYYCRVEFDQGTYSDLRFHVEFNEAGAPQLIGSYSNCYVNIETSPDLTFFYAVDNDNNILGTFTFYTNLSFSFIPSPDIEGQIYLRRCKESKIKPPHSITRQEEGEESTVQLPFSSQVNPVASSTILQYSLPKSQNISIVLYDALGQAIEVLQATTLMDAGNHELNIDLSHLPSGIYFCILQTNQKRSTIKLQKL